MPNLTATRYARAIGVLSSTFSTARESDSASHFDSSTSSNIEVYQFFRDSGKGSTNYRMYRFFAVFDFSSYIQVQVVLPQLGLMLIQMQQLL